MPMPRVTLLLVLALAIPAGCIENMGDLKETLGVTEPAPPTPTFLPPVAKAQAAVTTALVGVPVAFTSTGTRDPQGLPLDFAWEFGDASRARGPAPTHAYGAPGEYTAKLLVTNTAGLADHATLRLQVISPDGAPDAAIRVLGADGLGATRGTMGAPLRFDALASDPEGHPLTYAWAFGDGAASHDASTTHAYDAPGAYDVSLRVTDRAGNQAHATTRVLVDASWRASGAFEPARADGADVPIHVAAGAQELHVRLTYPAGHGLNDLEAVLLDATGAEVARTSGEGEPGATGEQTRALTLGAGQLAPWGAGAWTVQVLRERGLAVEWTLTVDERV